MAPAEFADSDSVARRVGIGVVVSGDSFKQHGSGVAVLVPAAVVGAGVAARGISGGGQSTVGADQGLGEGVGSIVDTINLEGNNFGGSGVSKWVGDRRFVYSLSNSQRSARTY